MRKFSTLVFFALLAATPAHADPQRECSNWQTTSHERSVVACTQAMQRLPGIDWPVLNRGWAYYKLQRYEEAIADFTRVLTISPKLTKAYTNRGLAYTQTGDNLRALADFTRLVELEPRADDGLALRGWVLTKLGQWSEARKDAERALSIKSSNPYALYVRGLVAFEERRIDQAAEDFTRSVSLGFVQPMAHIMRAEAYRARGDDALAIEIYRVTLAAEAKGRDDVEAHRLARDRLHELQREKQDPPVTAADPGQTLNSPHDLPPSAFSSPRLGGSL